MIPAQNPNLSRTLFSTDSYYETLRLVTMRESPNSQAARQLNQV